GIRTYMKGHTQVSCKGWLKRFKPSNDYCKTADEYASTIICGSCFRHLRKQALG
ncbi:hypothetical protein K501DRAFT_182916, partial [Backusella circina FSU 941]